jgi:hypothetical protein
MQGEKRRSGGAYTAEEHESVSEAVSIIFAIEGCTKVKTAGMDR